MQDIALASVVVNTVKAGAAMDNTDQLAVEEPLELHLMYGEGGARTKQSVSVTMRTPGNDAELSAGFLFTEGILRERDQIADIKEGAFGENTVLVSLNNEAIP